MSRRRSRAVADPLSSRQLLTICAVVGAALVTLLGVFGSGDIEETANTSYSIGATMPVRGVSTSHGGIHTILGIPVFDTAQGTGDRLPYQASWGQSVSWPLRFLVSSEFYSLARSLFFLIPGLFLCLSTLQTWLPRLSLGRAVLFAVLANSPLGLFLRQNDWSDHYVQVIGIAAVAMFLMRREFHEESPVLGESYPKTLALCVFVAVNGVVTGHPGLWPVALFVWLSFAMVFATQLRFRQSMSKWIRSQTRLVALAAAASVVTAAVSARDLLAELSSEAWAAGRLSRTPGLFSEFAFEGIYGLSDGGSLPEGVKRVVSTVLATTVMPLFVMLDTVLPQLLRASDFREMPRIEFSGALIMVALALGLRSLAALPVRRFMTQIVVCQALVWMSVVASTLDLLPPVLASSGAWMTLTVVLIINLFLTFLLLDVLPHRKRAARVLSFANVALVAYWCLIQFGFASFGASLRVPERYPSRFSSAEQIVESDWYAVSSTRPDRVVIAATPSFYDFVGFVVDGYPVVAPSDPKMRASGHLQSNFAFNFSINSPRFDGMSPDQVDRTLDFLQVSYVLVGEPTRSDALQPPTMSEGVQSVLNRLGPPVDLSLSQASYEVFSRDRFSVFVFPGSSATKSVECPVLFEACPVITESTRLSTSAEPHLRQCHQDCLWTFQTPDIGASDVLLVPVTYDSALTVRDAAGSRLDTSSVGGFLGVSAENGLDEGMLTVTLSPDARMLSRVGVSYLNLGVFLFLLGCAASPWVKSLRRKLRVE